MGRMMFRIYRDAANEWRWQLRARNGRVLGDSGEGYHDRRAARKAVEGIQAGAAQAGIIGGSP